MVADDVLSDLKGELFVATDDFEGDVALEGESLTGEYLADEVFLDETKVRASRGVLEEWSVEDLAFDLSPALREFSVEGTSSFDSLDDTVKNNISKNYFR